MKMKITLHGVAYEVEVEVLDEGDGFFGANFQSQVPRVIPAAPVPAFNTTPAAPAPITNNVPAAPTEKSILSPVGGTIVEVKLRSGDKVTKGQEILILEAMKMHTSIAAHLDGVIKSIPVAAGDTVREGQVLVEFE